MFVEAVRSHDVRGGRSEGDRAHPLSSGGVNTAICSGYVLNR